MTMAEPGRLDDERAMLDAWLDYDRASLLAKCAARYQLGDTFGRQRPTACAGSTCTSSRSTPGTLVTRTCSVSASTEPQVINPGVCRLGGRFGNLGVL
jgi:hypothetical protein